MYSLYLQALVKDPSYLMLIFQMDSSDLNSPDIYFEGNLGLLNSPFLRDVLLYVNAQEPSGAAVPGILYSVSNVYIA